MKRKIGTLIDEEVIKLAKRRAAEENRPLSDVIQDALVSYLSGNSPHPRVRDEAFRLFCERPIRVTREQFKEVLEEDIWEQ